MTTVVLCGCVKGQCIVFVLDFAVRQRGYLMLFEETMEHSVTGAYEAITSSPQVYYCNWLTTYPQKVTKSIEHTQ